jgi:valyl-tRNA synthetase
LAGRAPAVNRGYDSRRVEEARNFCNKLWNVARFIEDKVGDEFTLKNSVKAESSADAWMLSKLQQATERLTEYLETYRLSEAYELIYHLVWDDFADWYIEASKASLNKGVLAHSLETILKLAHPFAPFVTETIWQTLKWEEDSLLITSPWPSVAKVNHKQAEEFEEVKAIVSEIRYINGVLHLNNGIRLYHKGDTLIESQAALIQALARLKGVQAVEDGQGLHLTATKRVCWLDLDQESMNAFLNQLKVKREDQERVIKQLEGRLGNKSYVDNAPKAVVQQTKDQLAEAKELLAKVQTEHDRFSQA